MFPIRLASAVLLGSALLFPATGSAQDAPAAGLEAASSAESAPAAVGNTETASTGSTTEAVEASGCLGCGRIKNVRIKKRRVGSGFKITTNITDDGNGWAAQVDSVSVHLQRQSDGPEAPTATLNEREITSRLRSESVDFGWATPPDGTYLVLTDLIGAGGEPTGAEQEFAVTVIGEEVTVVPRSDVGSEPFVQNLDFTVNDCGNGKLKARVGGSDAGAVAAVNFLFEEPFEGPAPMETETSGSLVRSRTNLSETNADLGALGEALRELPEAGVTVTVSAFNAEGTVIGTATVEATAKYGDILIDGVPLEFD